MKIQSKLVCFFAASHENVSGALEVETSSTVINPHYFAVKFSILWDIWLVIRRTYFLPCKGLIFY